MFRISRRFLVLLAVIVGALVLFVTPVWAAATATSVSLNAAANCTNADLDIGLVSVGAHREYGLTSTIYGADYEFEQPTGIGDFNGVYVGYGMALSGQPDGTLVGSYAYVGETPPSAADTAEWFVVYECDPGGNNTVLYTCFGPYGNCPKTVAEYVALTTPGCDVMLPVPATAVGGTFVVDAQTYWKPGEPTDTVIAAGNSAKVIGVDASGQYYKIAWGCDFLWVPVNTIGPNFDAVWNGAPLPTGVVD